MPRKAIIICQAGHEVSNVLDIYDSNKDNYDAITIISNRTDSYKRFFILQSIDADYKVWTFEHFSTSTPWKWKRLIKTYKEEISELDTTNADVFYTCVCDINLVLRLKYFQKSSTFYYRPGKELLLIDKEGLPDFGVLKKLKAYMVKFVTEIVCGHKLIFKNHGDSFTLAFSPVKFNHIVLDTFSNEYIITQKYSYTPNVIGNNLVILFTEPYRNKFQTREDYSRMNVNIVKSLQAKGYQVIMKGHPRIGILESIKELVDDIVPIFVPSEFIDYSIFQFAIGFVSTSLCNSAKYIPTYSVIDMCNVIDKRMSEEWHVYLDKNSNNKIEYITSFEEL